MNRTRNGMTQAPFNKEEEVYRIKSPNVPGAYYLVKKNSLLSLLGNPNRTRIPTVRALNSLVHALKNNRMTHVGHLRSVRINVPIMRSNLRGIPNHTPKQNYLLQKWNENYGLVPVRDPLYGVPLNLKRISLNKINKKNLRSARLEKRQNTKNTNEYHKNVAQKMIKKMVQKIVFRNNFPHVWINSNGKVINTPANNNIIRYGPQGGPEVLPHIIKHMNPFVNKYLRAHPNLKPHYYFRELFIKK